MLLTSANVIEMNTQPMILPVFKSKQGGSFTTYHLYASRGRDYSIGKASSNFASLRTVIPMSIVRQWSLKDGDKLDWSWEARNSEMVVVAVRKVKAKG